MNFKSTKHITEKFVRAHDDLFHYPKLDLQTINQEIVDTSLPPCTGPAHAHRHSRRSNQKSPQRQIFKRVTLEQFLTRAASRFGDQYAYTSIKDFKLSGKIEVKCKSHNETFIQDARNHYRGHHACRRCANALLRGPATLKGSRSSNTELRDLFIQKARIAHGQRYGYTEFEYVSETTPGVITCREHGQFLKMPLLHIRGKGCPQCSKKNQFSNSLKRLYKLEGAAYGRAVKRLQAGKSIDESVVEGYIRHLKTTNPITLWEMTYPNFAEACRQEPPHSTKSSIWRWIRDGMNPEVAFKHCTSTDGRLGVVYRVTCIPTRKVYIGLTIQTLAVRWAGHVQNALRGSIQTEGSLHAEIRRLGKKAFTIEYMDNGILGGGLENKERKWIQKLDCQIPSGMNISAGGASGGSRPKKTIVDGIHFDSAREAAAYLSETRGISLHAAKWRITNNKIDCKTLAKRGTSLVRSHAYKTWSYLVRGKANPTSSEYDERYVICESWKLFESFLMDLGHPPLNTKLERIDPTKGYEKHNCMWAQR